MAQPQQAKTFVFGASKLTPNPTDHRKITPDAEWTQHRNPNPEYLDSTAWTQSFGYYEDNDRDLEETDNNTPINDPALDALRAAVLGIELQVNVNREAARFQAEALTSIQQSNASIKETNAAVLAMFRAQGLPANPAPGQQPLGPPNQGTNPQGPSAPVYFTFGAPAQNPLPQGAPAPLRHQFGAPAQGPLPQGPPAPLQHQFGAPAQGPLPQGAPTPLQHQFGAPTLGYQLPNQPAPESYPQGPPAPEPFPPGPSAHGT